MKTVSSLKSDKNESPKTPGGISKSLLTPCRRLGLSRNWKKAGPSPFVSPITGSNSSSTEVKVEKRVTRKRKERVAEDEIEDQNEKIPLTTAENDGILHMNKSNISVPSNINEDNLVDTPSRHIEMPRRKKSKTVLPTGNNCNETSGHSQNKEVQKPPQRTNSKEFTENDTENSILKAETVTTPVRVKSKGKIKNNKSLLKSISKTTSKVVVGHDAVSTDVEVKKIINDLAHTKQEICEETTENKTQSPNELTKECMVVIQKKIFKIDNSKTMETEPTEIINKFDIKNSTPSQTIFDSDTDEVPLSHFNKKENIIVKNVDPDIITIDEDDDFTEPNKIKKLEDKNTSTGGLKTSNKKKTTLNKIKKPAPEPIASSQSSNSFDDDEDFEFDNKKTILIHKTYNKITKPLKAKSTGSITQRDIDELKARIEMKKKLLLAKAMTEETGELRGLIKKWQKGCQDALMELMDLMKTKFPDKQNMDYSDMLQMLKIPENLVGYDSENDCFNTPDDANIILSKFDDF